MTSLTAPSPYHIAPAEWYLPYEGAHHRVRGSLVTGLTCPAHYADSEGRLRIDATIAGLIVKLNRAGYSTEFSCSGLPEDHEEDMLDCFTRMAYIAFQRYEPALPIPHHLYWDHDCIRVRPETTIEEMRAGWVVMEEGLS